MSGAGVSGLTSLAGGGVGSGAGADAGGGGGGGGASSFFLQPAKVKAQANTIIIDNDKNSFFILTSRYTKVSQYVLRICGFYIQGALTLAPLLDSVIKSLNIRGKGVHCRSVPTVRGSQLEMRPQYQASDRPTMKLNL